MKIQEKLSLPCGAVLPNRIGKSAMSENMAAPLFFPNEKFNKAYKTWIDGGTGLCVTGNVMIDSRYLGEANNVVIEEGIDNLSELKNWADASSSSDSHIWVQLNHPGKQSPKFLTKEPVAPSALALPAPLNNMFNAPRALDEKEIFEIIERFGHAAKTVKDCGFDGVQIHGAHGYLVSQFLSSKHNQRNDQWGGDIDGRMKFVIEVYKKIRENVGSEFPIGIKINSADFGRGGFSHHEAVEVARKLSELGIDLIEISGGSYEAPVMTGAKIKGSTQKREAYFLEYAADIKKVISCPLMVTGGFRTGEFMEEVLSESDQLDVVGLGRALCLNPNFSNEVLAGNKVVSEVKRLTSGSKLIDSIFPLEIIWYTMQIHRMGAGKKPNPRASVYLAIFSSMKEMGVQSIKRVRS
jgi:2,4-dienoyl-CoA reductase-like NADH-dependent reductase (Old Yellow Enzyme family)